MPGDHFLVSVYLANPFAAASFDVNWLLSMCGMDEWAVPQTAVAAVCG
jgi:hypothetical protein